MFEKINLNRYNHKVDCFVFEVKCCVFIFSQCNRTYIIISFVARTNQIFNRVMELMHNGSHKTRIGSLVAQIITPEGEIFVKELYKKLYYLPSLLHLCTFNISRSI